MLSNGSFLISCQDVFETCFSPRVAAVTPIHLHILYQMCFNDFEFVCDHAVGALLATAKTQERADFLNVALRLVRKVLDPAAPFRERYHDAFGEWPPADRCATLMASVQPVVFEVLKSYALRERDFVAEVLNFYKSEELEACNDEVGIVWSKLVAPVEILQQREENKLEMRKKRRSSLKKLSNIELEERQVEYLRNVARKEESFEYNLNALLKKSERKRVKHIRHRVLCFLSEERKEG